MGFPFLRSDADGIHAIELIMHELPSLFKSTFSNRETKKELKFVLFFKSGIQHLFIDKKFLKKS